jgi:alanine dehydrogenase
MRIGVPREIKPSEYRVGLTPGVVERLTGKGHTVFVETNAGLGIGVADEDFVRSGARIASDAADVFGNADLIVKVKEPQPGETAMLRPDHVLFTYLHLAANEPLVAGLCASGCTAIAYETVTDPQGRLPLLTPMSQVAGRMAVDVGAYYLLRPHGKIGMLLGGVPGVQPARVVILGGGVAGRHAADIALGHRADVTLFDISLSVLAELEARFDGRLKTQFSTSNAIEAAILQADLVVGTVLIPGASAPKLVRREHLARMKPGAVLVDVSIDQGGCFETSRPTTHDDPVFEVDGVVHYCVANMPGAAPFTSTFALGAATAPYIEALADKGVAAAFADDPGLAAGLNIQAGQVTHPAVSRSLLQSRAA